MKCPYCGKDIHLVTGEEIYPHRNAISLLRRALQSYNGIILK
jgi:hypothetical protein